MAKKPVLVKRTGERKMANAVDRAFELLDKIDPLKQEAIEELLEQRRDIDTKLTKLGYNDTPPVRVRSRERKPRSCKVCIKAGYPDLASGHIARGHAKWLAKQPKSIQDRF